MGAENSFAEKREVRSRHPAWKFAREVEDASYQEISSRKESRVEDVRTRLSPVPQNRVVGGCREGMVGEDCC